MLLQPPGHSHPTLLTGTYPDFGAEAGTRQAVTTHHSGPVSGKINGTWFGSLSCAGSRRLPQKKKKPVEEANQDPSQGGQESSPESRIKKLFPLLPAARRQTAVGLTGSQLIGFLSPFPLLLLRDRPAVGARLMATIKSKMPLLWPTVLPHL